MKKYFLCFVLLFFSCAIFSMYKFKEKKEFYKFHDFDFYVTQEVAWFLGKTALEALDGEKKFKKCVKKHNMRYVLSDFQESVKKNNWFKIELVVHKVGKEELKAKMREHFHLYKTRRFLMGCEIQHDEKSPISRFIPSPIIKRTIVNCRLSTYTSIRDYTENSWDVSTTMPDLAKAIALVDAAYGDM